MSKTIFEDESLAIRLHSAASVQMVSLIGRAVWGSGGTRYRIRDAQEKVELLKGAQFITLHVHESLAGVYVVLGKQVAVGDSARRAYYRTYLALDPDYKGKGYGTLLVLKTREFFVQQLGGAGLLYGYIEVDNLSSLRASQHAGYQCLASFRTAVFSRLRPRLHPSVRPLQPSERTAVIEALQLLYADHNLRDFQESLDPGRYFVYEDELGIAAGVQIESCEWVIERLPGISGWLLVNLVSRTPLLKRVFDARRCRFLKLGNLYTRPGSEARLFDVMESVVARYGVGSAMIFHDPRSPVYQRIAGSGSFGLLNSGVGATVHMMGSLVGSSAAEIRQFQDRPIVLSPLDVG